MATREILDEIAAERARQDAQWGGPEHDDTHSSEEWSAFRAKQEAKVGEALFWCDVSESRVALVKIAALAVAQIEVIDRSVAEGQ